MLFKEVNMDKYFMSQALEQAKNAKEIGEVPIGAVIVKNGKIIARGFNKREILKNPLAHAEILAINKASEVLDSWRLLDSTMYVTIEPCAMCAGAIVNSRIKRLVIGAMDPKMGACGSIVDLVRHEKFNHKVKLEIGVLEEECSQIMKDFFKKLRDRKKIKKENK